MSAQRSLGTLIYPNAEITSFNGNGHELILTVSTRTRKVKIKMTVYCLTKLVTLAQEGTGKQREYAQREWGTYLGLKKKTGYTPPEGQTDG
jgi:hypothetical protein